MKKEVIYCPLNGWDCPYFDKNGRCKMYPEADPMDECEDFSFFWDKGDDYICVEDVDDDDDEPADIDDDCGYDPYLGCYTDDC